MEWKFNEYDITDDPAKVDVGVVCDLLAATYWASDRPRPLIRKSIENSICFSVICSGRQVGFARVVTDRAVFAWIADVVVAPAHRGKGLGKCLVECIQNHPDVPDSTQLLKTKDAHGLYEKFGFESGECMFKRKRGANSE